VPGWLLWSVSLPFALIVEEGRRARGSLRRGALLRLLWGKLPVEAIANGHNTTQPNKRIYETQQKKSSHTHLPIYLILFAQESSGLAQSICGAPLGEEVFHLVVIVVIVVLLTIIESLQHL